MNNYDDTANDRADNHARLVHGQRRQSKKQAIQSALRERNHQTILNEQLRKKRLGTERFRKLMCVLSVITILAVIIRLSGII